jgi:ABC-type dipeptide/oligopeptide/nickel transport system permease subunit
MSGRSDFWPRARRHPGFVLGGALSALLALAAIVSLFWQPWPPAEIDIPGKLQPPSAAHWLGTDSLGRDIASQLLVGAQNSIVVGIVAVAIGLVAGVALGALASARRGWVEELVMRLSDFAFAFPALLSAIMLGAIAGPGLATGIVAIGLFNIPVFARLTRGAANAVWAREYVLAARAAGKGHGRLRHRDPGRGGAVLPGPGHAAAAPELGTHAERGAGADVPGAVAGGLARAGHRAGGAGAEPDGRRPARPARSEAGAQAMSPQAIA